MSPEVLPWPTDPRYLVSDGGAVFGPSGRPVGSAGADGYRRVSYRDTAGVRRCTTVHAMVCETFHGPRPPGREAAHRNGVRGDCRASNVRWEPRPGNAADRIPHGTNGLKLTSEDVEAIRAEPDASTRELGRRFGVTAGTIRHVRRGHTWSGLPATSSSLS